MEPKLVTVAIVLLQLSMMLKDQVELYYQWQQMLAFFTDSLLATVALVLFCSFIFTFTHQWVYMGLNILHHQNTCICDSSNTSHLLIPRQHTEHCWLSGWCISSLHSGVVISKTNETNTNAYSHDEKLKCKNQRIKQRITRPKQKTHHHPYSNINDTSIPKTNELLKVARDTSATFKTPTKTSMNEKYLKIHLQHSKHQR